MEDLVGYCMGWWDLVETCEEGCRRMVGHGGVWGGPEMGVRQTWGSGGGEKLQHFFLKIGEICVWPQKLRYI